MSTGGAMSGVPSASIVIPYGVDTGAAVVVLIGVLRGKPMELAALCNIILRAIISVGDTGLNLRLRHSVYRSDTVVIGCFVLGSIIGWFVLGSMIGTATLFGTGGIRVLSPGACVPSKSIPLVL